MAKRIISKGTVLLAQPFMLDPNFKRAVVLVVDHHKKDGSVGFVLNQKINTSINELVNDFPEIESPVYVGGPVAKDTLHYIHDVGDILDDSIKVVDGVYWGGDYEKLKFLIENKLILPHNIRFFLGYSGWSAGQLADEVEYGSWMLTDMYANYAFKEKPENLWNVATHNKGGSYTVIAEMPPTDGLN